MKTSHASLAVWAALMIGCVYIFIPTFFFSGADVDLAVYSKTSAREIGQQLKDKGIIHFQTPFLILSKLIRADRHLKTGLYRLNDRMSLWEVLRVLVEGRSDLLALRIPEGYTMEQIAGELQKMGVCTAADFLKAAKDPLLLKNLGIEGPTAEGFLFPDTYRVPLGASCEELMELMVHQFWNEVGSDFKDRCDSMKLTPYQVVIMASIVEKEARDANERPMIADVLYNRIHKKMRLQVNATLNYILNTKHAWLTTRQIQQTQSPYNTYRHRGLPPTPICNPGIASIEAVLSPENVPYLYYVAAGDGSHFFATTFAQHQSNIRKAIRILRSQKARGTSK